MKCFTNLKLCIAFLFMALFMNLQASEPVKILCIGNSFTVDAVEDYLAPIAKSAGKDVIIGYPYKGGTSLEEHCNYISTNNPIYNYRKIVDGVLTTRSATIMKTAITDEAWDYVVIQTAHYYGGVYDEYFPWMTNIIDYVKANISNPNAKYLHFMVWADDASSTKADFSIYNYDQIKMYNAIVDCTFRAAEEAKMDGVIPFGTAVQNCRSSFIGDRMTRDGYHLNYDYGRFTASCTFFEYIFGIPATSINYRPNTITDALADVCKNAAHFAIENPKEATSMSEQWGVDPNNIGDPLPRPVYISFDGQRYDSYLGSMWNTIMSANEGATIQNLVDNKMKKTSVKVAITSRFGGTLTTGATATTTDLDMPEGVSSTSFWGNGEGSYSLQEVREGVISITGLYPGQKYDFSVFGSIMDVTGNLETSYTFAGENEVTVTLDVANNTSNIATAKSVVASSVGRVFVTIKAGDNNTDQYKRFCIGAMRIEPNLTVPYKMPVYINLTNESLLASEDNWNNVTSYLAGAKVATLKNKDAEATEIGLEITKPFGGFMEEGTLFSETDMDIPSNASKSGYWVNEIAMEDGTLVPEAEMLFTGLDATKSYNFCMFASRSGVTEQFEAEYTAVGANNRFAVLNANNNTTQTVWINDVIPASDGTIRFTVTPGPASADAHKLGYLNAMAITYPTTITLDPDSGITPDQGDKVWDGISKIQPVLGANDWYLVSNGAELAWIAEQASTASFAGNVLLTNDIDLGGHEWTPIGSNGKAFNGNFDGAGHTISNLNLTVTSETTSNIIGFIGQTNSKKATIKNVNISGSMIIENGYTLSGNMGTLIGKANSLNSVENCHSDVDIVVKGMVPYLGGLVGFYKSANIINCSYSGDILVAANASTGSKSGVGGVCGITSTSTSGALSNIVNTYFTGTITSQASSKLAYFAPIIASINYSGGGNVYFKNCYVAGSWNLQVAPGIQGILYGRSGATINVENCYLMKTDGVTPINDVIEKESSDFHNGAVAYLLNGDQSAIGFGQNLAEENSLPIIVNEVNRVYKTEYYVDNMLYATTYNNASLIFPAEPQKEGCTFEGWYDSLEGGTKYDENSVADRDFILYARFKTGVGVADVYDSDVEVVNERFVNALGLELGEESINSEQLVIHVMYMSDGSIRTAKRLRHDK